MNNLKIIKINALLYGLLNNSASYSNGVLFLAVFLLFAAYYPTLFYDYVTQDQLRSFRYTSYNNHFLDRFLECKDLIVDFYIQTGRPLVWMSECIEHSFVDSIKDFKFLRLGSFFIVVVTFFSLLKALELAVNNTLKAAVIAVLFLLNPGYSFMYLQGLAALMVLISIVLSSISFINLMFFFRHPSIYYKYLYLVISGIFFLTSCMIYPAWAFIAVTLIVIYLFSNEEYAFKKKLINTAYMLTFLVLISIIYYFLTKKYYFIPYENSDINNNLGIYEVTMELNFHVILHRVKMILHYLYATPLINFISAPGLSCLIIIVFSIIYNYRNMIRDNKRSLALLSLFIILQVIGILLLLLGSLSPWIVSNMDNFTTRHAIPLTLFLCYAIVFSISLAIQCKTKTINNRLLLIIYLYLLIPTTLTQSNSTVLEIVTTISEIKYIKAKLVKWIESDHFNNKKLLLVIRPSVPRLAAIEKFYTDKIYGFDNVVLASSKNPVSIPWMINAAFKELKLSNKYSLIDCGFDTKKCARNALINHNNIVISYAYGLPDIHDKIIKIPEMPYIINLSELTSYPTYPLFSIIDFPKILASSTLEGMGPGGLLKFTQPGWHAEKNPDYPQSIKIDFKETKQFTSISFLPQSKNLVSRAPKKVKINISNDNKNWIEIVNSNDICLYDNATEMFKLLMPKAITTQYIKIDIIENCGDPHLLTLRGLVFN